MKAAATGATAGGVTVGLVGMPNVGKSSVINSLKRDAVVKVGDMPGITRGLQEIHLDKTVRLLDTPGVVFSAEKGGVAGILLNSVKVDKLPDIRAPVEELLARFGAQNLAMVFNTPAFSDSTSFLRHVAEARGKIRKGGAPDLDAAARAVLQDVRSGKVPFYTLPPPI